MQGCRQTYNPNGQENRRIEIKTVIACMRAEAGEIEGKPYYSTINNPQLSTTMHGVSYHVRNSSDAALFFS